MSQFQKDHLSLLGSPHKSFCSSYFLLPSLFQCPIAQLIEFYPNWASPSLDRRNRGVRTFRFPIPCSPARCTFISWLLPSSVLLLSSKETQNTSLSFSYTILRLFFSFFICFQPCFSYSCLLTAYTHILSSSISKMIKREFLCSQSLNWDTVQFLWWDWRCKLNINSRYHCSAVDCHDAEFLHGMKNLQDKIQVEC